MVSMMIIMVGYKDGCNGKISVLVKVMMTGIFFSNSLIISEDFQRFSKSF